MHRDRVIQRPDAAAAQGPPVVDRAVAIAGRLAQAPRRAAAGTVNLLHGEQNPVMPVGPAFEADGHLRARGARWTLARYPGLWRGIDQRLVNAVARPLGERQAEA